MLFCLRSPFPQSSKGYDGGARVGEPHPDATTGRSCAAAAAAPASTLKHQKTIIWEAMDLLKLSLGSCKFQPLPLILLCDEIAILLRARNTAASNSRMVTMHAVAVEYGGNYVDLFLKVFKHLQSHFNGHSESIKQMVRHN